jgi:hypothetical protein
MKRRCGARQKSCSPAGQCVWAPPLVCCAGRPWPRVRPPVLADGGRGPCAVAGPQEDAAEEGAAAPDQVSHLRALAAVRAEPDCPMAGLGAAQGADQPSRRQRPQSSQDHLGALVDEHEQQPILRLQHKVRRAVEQPGRPVQQPRGAIEQPRRPVEQPQRPVEQPRRPEQPPQLNATQAQRRRPEERPRWAAERAKQRQPEQEEALEPRGSA